MIAKFTTTATRTWPISRWTLLASAIGGTVSLLLQLSNGVDLATAVAFIDAVSISLGIWISFNLYSLLTQLYKFWMLALLRRITDLKRLVEPLPSAEPRTHDDGPNYGFVGGWLG